MILEAIKQHLCSHRRFSITSIQTEGFPKGSMLVFFKCADCDKRFSAFHDLTETERPEFRTPFIERMLIQQGFLRIDH